MTEGVEARSRMDARTPVFALDQDWRFTYLNGPAERLFGHELRKLRGREVWDEIGESVRERYREVFETALAERRAVETQVRCPVLQQWFRVQAYPLQSGISVHLELLSGQVERERELERREEALRDAYEVTADREASLRQRIENLLGVVRGVLATEVGLVSRYDEGVGRFEILCVDAAGRAPIEAGEQPDPSWTRTCREVVRTEQTLCMGDLSTQTPDLYDASAGVRSYIGAPIRVNGEAFGTFCFFSTERRSEDFDDWETTYVDLFADWVGAAIERNDGLG